MQRKKALGIWVAVAFIIGVIATVIITTQLNMSNQVVASSEKQVKLSSEDEAFLNQLNNLFVNAAKSVKPSVVTVYSAKVIEMRRFRSPFEFFFNDEFFNQFFGQRRPPQQREREDEYVKRGMGSGVIVKSNGTIVTNYHVVKDADDIRIKTTEGEEYNAELLGADPKTDVAVIKIDADNLSVSAFGSSEEMEVGEWVMAIGSPFTEELRQTVTKGIVSAKGRTGLGLTAGQSGYENFIQTDAAINPGNSGGALINLKGEIIGINTAIVTPSGGFAGIGFAIPIDLVQRIMKELIEKGRVVRGYLGVYIQDVDQDLAQALGLEEQKGALITQVEEGGPADEAGIRPSDVIIQLDGEEVDNANDLKFMVADISPGETVDVLVNRDGKEKKLEVTIGEMETEEESEKMAGKPSKKLGFEVANVTRRMSQMYGYKQGSGVVIVQMNPTSEAYRKGLREGDLITEVNHNEISNVSEFNDEVESVESGDTVILLAQRGDNRFFVALKISKEK